MALKAWDIERAFLSALGLDGTPCGRVVITLEVGTWPTVEVTRNFRDGEVGALTAVISHYELRPKSEDALSDE
jgi:hypothetical protein